MEIIEAIEKIGIPGVIVLTAILAGRSIWSFFQDVYWPHCCERQRREEERREREAQREADQATWLVERLADISANLQRVADRMDRLERACQEKLLNIPGPIGGDRAN